MLPKWRHITPEWPWLLSGDSATAELLVTVCYAAFQSFKFDPDTCAKLQRIVQRDSVWMTGYQFNCMPKSLSQLSRTLQYWMRSVVSATTLVLCAVFVWWIAVLLFKSINYWYRIYIQKHVASILLAPASDALFTAVLFLVSTCTSLHLCTLEIYATFLRLSNVPNRTYYASKIHWRPESWKMQKNELRIACSHS